MAGAFAGLRFLDLSRLLPGPYCSLLFADLGAEVIKVEEPGRGDYARRTPPYWASPTSAPTSSCSTATRRASRSTSRPRPGRRSSAGWPGRRTCCSRASGRASWPARPRWEALRPENPRLVYCAISGYGQDGPYRNLVGHDVNYMGYAGALAVTGPRDGAPLTPGVQVADLGGGALMAAFASRRRSTTGARRPGAVRGRLDDGRRRVLADPASRRLLRDRPPAGARQERLNGGWPCYGVYETADGGHVTLGRARAAVLGELRRLVGREDLQAQHAKDAERDRVEASSASSSGRARAPRGSSSSTRPTCARARCSGWTRSSGTLSS